MPFRPHPALINAADDGDPSSDFEDDSHATLKQQLHLLPQQDDAKIDHRKKRRNRTTQSCLSCHQNKRKCDRGRPCGRCITLGLTGFCVYEVGEKTRDKDSDEVTQLRNRVAELEGVVRELKNKPQPRWAANAIVAPSTTTSSDSQQQPVALPSTPAPTISFPKESWHVRSARKDTAAAAMDRENDGVSSSHDKKKRKLADTSLDTDNSTYRVKTEVAPPSATSPFFQRDANENDGSWLPDDGITMNLVDGTVGLGVGHDISSASTLVLGSPLFADALLPSPISPPFRRASHPNIPLGSDSTSLNNGRFGLGLANPNVNGNGTSSTFGNVPFMQDPTLGGLATRRSLTGPLPTISSLSRRNAINPLSSNPSNGNNAVPASPTSSSKSAKSSSGSSSGAKQQPTGPPCACLADPTATQFVAHLSRNVRSTVEFLETRHRPSASGPNGERGDTGANGEQRSAVEDPLVKTVHECGVMRALAQLDKSIRLSSGSTKRAARLQKQQQQQQQSSSLQPPHQHQQQPQHLSLSQHSHHLQHHHQANIPIPAPLTPPAHLRYLDTDPNEESDSDDQPHSHHQQQHYPHGRPPSSRGGNGSSSSPSTTTAVGSGGSGSSSPHTLSVHDHDSTDVSNADGNGSRNGLDDLELMDMEMINAPSPVNLLSEEALHALSSPSHAHSHVSHAHSNALSHTQSLSHYHVRQVSHDHYHHHPLSSERDGGGNSNGGGGWSEPQQHHEHDGKDGGGGVDSGGGPNHGANNGAGGSPSSQHQQQQQVQQHQQQQQQHHVPPPTTSSSSYFGTFDNYDFLSQSEDLFRS